MKVCVLMPVYNRQAWVKIAINSILQQTHKDLHLIVYNDGSTDKSLAVCQELARADSRVTVIGEKANNGIVYARNKLLEAVDSQFACWMDSDDVANIYRLERQLVMALTGSDIVFSNWVSIRREMPNFKEVPRKAPIANPAYPTIFFNATKAPRFEEKVRGDTPTTISGEDVDWHNRFLQRGVVKSTHPEILYYYRRHGMRVSDWKRSPGLNPDWHKRMWARIKKK